MTEHTFTIDQSFWDIFPEVTVAVMVAHNVNNHDQGLIPASLLDEANDAAVELVPNDPISENDLIAEWRTAFRQFKTKKGARFAVENLLKRAKNGKGVGHINPIVDIYNSVSLHTGFPVGCLDYDKLTGTLELTTAKGGEPFVAIGEDENEPALPGEVIYRDEAGVTSRGWAWRDATATEATEDSTNLILYMECLKPEWADAHQAAIDQLTESIEKYIPGASVTTQIATINQPTLTLN